MMKIYSPLILFLLAFVSLEAEGTSRNSAPKAVRQMYTFETEHFRVNYPKELQEPAKEISTILENLYETYKNKYGITLPNKTEVLVDDGPYSGGWALAIQNTIAIWVNDFNYNRRGNPNWLENVVAHEYAHIVSISSSFKMPSWMPYLQVGSFDHPNEKGRTEALYIYPSEVLPPWFFEGIAQYESSVNRGDSWDTHRDMILRTLALSDSLLSWDNMSVFNPASGRSDSYEMTYNHGFSLVKFIAETYGEDKLSAILRVSGRFGRLVFDRSIKEVLGITGKELYKEWKQHLIKGYQIQRDSIGTTVSGIKINELGFESWWPRFSPDESRLFYLNNMKLEYGRKYLLSESLDSLGDTAAEPRLEVPVVNSFYDFLNDSTVIFASTKGKKSQLSHARGNKRTFNLFTYELAPDTIKKPKYKPKKFEKQLTEYSKLQYPVFSPDKEQIAAAKHHMERHYLVIGDSSGKNFSLVYPPVANDTFMIRTIFSLDWSNDGSKIAMSYIDRDYRKIGYYALEDSSFHVVLNDGYDNRDPRFSNDGKKIYFSSDRSGVFNIYKLTIATGKLEQLTNVIGGAFTPDISKDEKGLVFSNYSGEGFGINYIDSIIPIFTDTITDSVKLELRLPQEIVDNSQSGVRKRYSYFPRKPIIIPTLISEEVLAEDGDPFTGVRHTKYGLIAGLMDPLSWNNQGNSITLFALSENPFKQFAYLFNRTKSAKKIAADFGVLFDSYMFPIDISLLYFTRNIPSQSQFVFNTVGYDSLATTNYSLQPSVWQLSLQKRRGDIAAVVSNVSRAGLFTSFMKYKANVEIGNNSYLFYTPATEFRVGAVATHFSGQWTTRSEISPTHGAVKLQYDFNHGAYANEEEVLILDKNGKVKENNAKYNFHNFRLQLEKSHPWTLIKAFDIEYRGGLQYTHVPKGTQFTIDSLLDSSLNANGNFPDDIPQFFLPTMQVPGYTYYYHGDSSLHELKDENGDVFDTVYTTSDSVLVSGRVLLDVHMSLRFPLWKGSINKKVAFLYFDQLYGAINGGGAIGAKSFSDIGKKETTFYPYVGAEMRLSTQAFNSFPLAIKFRWDQGLARKEPIGGARFLFSLGFSFDTWGIVSSPDGLKHAPAYMKSLQQ